MGGEGIHHPQKKQRTAKKAPTKKLETNKAALDHPRRKMTLIERRLRSLEEQARRASRKICGLQFQLRGRIESNAAQSLGTCPAIHRGRRNRLVKGTQRRKRRNLREKIRRILVAGTEVV